MGRGADDAFRDLIGLQEKMCRLFDEQSALVRTAKEAVPAHWSPPVDIYETEREFILLAEIPGMVQEDIHLELSDEVLILRGERPSDTRLSSQSYHRIERPHGVFQRLFRLPVGIDPAGVTATYRDGVLRVVLPKREGVSQRVVSVPVED
ncbi:MAG: Hsp20/alpha crystallin family protein [Deltaproteobacteria bacterium]|nr:Hsp20/alpha crystallin family protein [Deltaproteobacteria bacterium]